MKNLGYYNGKFGPLDEMTVPMNDRVCWFGDGVYDAGPCRNYHVFAMDEHVDRFFRSAAALDIRIPVTKDELKALLNDLVRKVDTGDLFVYYQVTRGTAVRDHTWDEMTGNLWVMLKPMTIGDCKTPIKLITTEDKRFFLCNIKTLNLIPSVMAAQKAKEAGCTEAVFYRPGGRVTECAHSNVHILKDGILRTAPLDELILPGIARAHLIAACGRLGIPVLEAPYTVDDLKKADEIITSSSTAPCVRACRVNGRDAGMKREDLFRALHQAVYDEYYSETDENTP